MIISPSRNVQPIRREETNLYGRLVAIPTTNLQLEFASNAYANAVSIDFPCLPEVIELARETEYFVTSSPVLPDGLHQYRSTKPMEIPIEFKLHMNDESYCKKGALTLLEIAARLHSFTLPVSKSGANSQVNLSAAQVSAPDSKGQGTDAATQSSAESPLKWKVEGDSADDMPYPPVTCWLNLMWTNADAPGISCIGYVRNARIRLKKPWLRGKNGAFNLPSAAEYSFTFVHAPNYSNDFSLQNSDYNPALGIQQNAMATHVRDKFYNTRAINTSVQYKGFGDES